MFYGFKGYPTKKKIIYIGLVGLAVFLVVLAGIIVWWRGKRIKTFPFVEGPFVEGPLGETREEKQKNMREALRKANESVPELSKEEQIKKQQEMFNALERANKK